MQETLTVASFVVAFTQFAKEVGIAGQWLRLVAVGAGIIGQVVTTGDYSPQSLVSGMLTGLTTTGTVALVKDVVPTNQPSQQ